MLAWESKYDVELAELMTQEAERQKAMDPEPEFRNLPNTLLWAIGCTALILAVGWCGYLLYESMR